MDTITSFLARRKNRFTSCDRVLIDLICKDSAADKTYAEYLLLNLLSNWRKLEKIRCWILCFCIEMVLSPEEIRITRERFLQAFGKRATNQIIH